MIEAGNFKVIHMLNTGAIYRSINNAGWSGEYSPITACINMLAGISASVERARNTVLVRLEINNGITFPAWNTVIGQIPSHFPAPRNTTRFTIVNFFTGVSFSAYVDNRGFLYMLSAGLIENAFGTGMYITNTDLVHN